MSGGAVFQRALSHLVSSGNNRPAVIKALEAGESGPRQFAYELGLDAGLEGEALLDRAAAVFLLFASLNLTDDLQDGDAGDYLDRPEREGPAVQFLLQATSFALMARAGVTPGDIAIAAEEMAAVAAGQVDEVRDEPWTADRYITVGERIAGQQYVAYATVLCSGGPLAAQARDIGFALGFAAHVAEDLRSKDGRLLSMPAADLDVVLALARRHGTWLSEQTSPAVRRAAGSLRLA